MENTQNMNEKEYTAHRLEMSRRALIDLLEKMERPYDELSDILVNAINRIEELQERGW